MTGDRRTDPIGATLVASCAFILGLAVLIESGIQDTGSSVASPVASALTSSLSVYAPPPGGIVFISSSRKASESDPAAELKVGCHLSSNSSAPFDQAIGSQTSTALVRRSVPATKP